MYQTRYPSYRKFFYPAILACAPFTWGLISASSAASWQEIGPPIVGEAVAPQELRELSVTTLAPARQSSDRWMTRVSSINPPTYKASVDVASRAPMLYLLLQQKKHSPSIV